DLCQALGIMPTRKYQNEGGPGVADIVNLLRTHSSERAEDVATFLSSVAFNWLIAGTDAHAKNYSLLLTTGPRVRLAPLYDVASVLPYDDIDLHKAKLSMKVGGEYRLLHIVSRHWQRLAHEVRVDADELLTSLRTTAQRLPDELHRVRVRVHEEGLNLAIVDRLTGRLIERAKACEQMLQQVSG